MDHLPIFMTLNGRSALIVGGSEAAARKATLVAECGAFVTILAPAPSAEMRRVGDRSGVVIHRRRFEAADVAGAAMAIVDTGDRSEDARIAAIVREAGVPVNVIDAPALSTFIVPAIVDRSPLVVAISSGGIAPILARRVRAAIEDLLPSNLGRLAVFAGRFRAAVTAVRLTGRSRRRFWERFFAGPVAARVLTGDEQGATEQMLSLINRPAADDENAVVGRVTIVGAGPGDPDLLTVKAVRALQEADVIVYDRLVGSAILDRGRRDAERVYVGKAKDFHSTTQDEINALLAVRARAGQNVVRLKGGDPYVFGRGGEERRHLRMEGIPHEVVPGITAALGCAAAAGIPLTDREHAQAVTLLTGQGQDGEPDLEWGPLARQTLVIYMGATVADRITRRLLAAGADPGLPAAVIINGTRVDGRVRTGRLDELPALAANAGDEPALLIIGEVVREAIAWHEAPVVRHAAG
ncbi:MAG: siroheme synthase CysG [Rhodospirillales bacterium]